MTLRRETLCAVADEEGAVVEDFSTGAQLRLDPDALRWLVVVAGPVLLGQMPHPMAPRPD